MSRSIKTVKCLMKHVGKTVHVVSADGFEFDAEVCLRGPAHDKWLCLFTDNEVADKDSYWWEASERYGHNCSRDYQITEELKSLTLVTGKKSKKDTVKYLTKAELDAARGHFCLLADGSKGFICCKVNSDFKPTRVLHNSTTSRGCEYTDKERKDDDAPDSIKQTFSRAFNANDEEDTFALQVLEVLEKYDGRKYRKKKAKKESPKTVEATEAKKKKKFLTASEISKGIGHFCKLSDGQEAFIASHRCTATICMHTKFGDGLGWDLYGEYDVDFNFKDRIKDYKYGWYINDEFDAQKIKIVSILDEPQEEKLAQSEKTILDMTVKELLEKLDEIIKCK